MRALLALALAACAACASGARSDPPPSDPKITPPTPSVDAAMTANPVEMKFVGMEPGRPPMARLRFDVTLSNGAGAPRWFLLPKEAARAPKSGAGVDGVEVSAIGPVQVGRFQGTGSVQALLLPAGAKVTIRRFTILSFQDTADGPATLEVVIARDFQVGGEDATAWFKSDPTTPATADVAEDDQKRAGSRHTPDRSEVPLTFTEDRRVQVSYNRTVSSVH